MGFSAHGDSLLLEWRRTTESRILSRMPGPRNSPWWEGKEREFVLDSVAVSWAGIPPYNPQLDPATKTYFTRGVSSVLKKTKQNRGGTSQLGWLYDQRYASTTGARYLRERARQYKGGHENAHTRDVQARIYANRSRPELARDLRTQAL